MIGFWADFLTFLQVAIGLFLIFIIMLQRGKGGGLVGALGGMGGASAFGPKADIQVLKLTIGLAVTWVVVACVSIFFNRSYATSAYNPTGDNAGVKKDADTKKDASTKDGTAKKDAAGAFKKDGDADTKADEKGPALENPAEKTAPADKSEPAADKAEKPAADDAKAAPAVEKPAADAEPETKK